MCSIGRLDLLQSHILDSIYDSQARALLAGHWDIPRPQLGFEAFVVGNKTYTYFGPWPTVLRMPVELFTHQFDGRLTQLSILLAFAVFMVATARLLWRVRELARGRRRDGSARTRRRRDLHVGRRRGVGRPVPRQPAGRVSRS